MKTPRERKRRSVRTEVRVARQHGGQRTPRSGAGHIKGDCRVKGKYRIECKETDKLSYRIHIEEWLRFVHEAMKAGEVPVLHITLTDKRGRKHELAMLRHADHLGILQSLKVAEDACEAHERDLLD